MKLPFPVSKAHAAFLFTVDKMYNNWPNSVYMWTFTMSKVYPDFRVMMYWQQLMDKLKREFPLLRGIRVVEVHPGTKHSGNIYGLSHGLHFHALFNQRVSIHWINRISRKFGFGHVFVRKVTQQEACYLGKYLTKDQPDLQKGCRRWGTIGWTGSTKVRDVQIDSSFHRNMREVQNKLKCGKLSPDIVHSIYVNTRLHGDVTDWPIQKYEYSNRSAEFFDSDDWRKHLGAVSGTGNAERQIKKLLPRGNKATREQSMQRIATMWKEKARRRALGHEGRYAEDMDKQRQRRVEAEPKPSEKIFLGPRGTPGDSPVKKQDILVGTLDYYLDKIPLKWAGTAPAIE